MLALKQQYERAVSPMIEAVRATSDDQLDLPTPCAEFDVRTLLGHLMWVARTMAKGARGEDADLTPRIDALEGAWRDEFASVTEDLAVAWSEPEALDRPEVAGLPRQVMARMPLLDLVIHLWDLDRATGQRHEPDPEVAQAMLEFIEQLAPQGRKMGAFDEEVAVSESASTFDKLLAVSGRDPNWKPE